MVSSQLHCDSCKLYRTVCDPCDASKGFKRWHLQPLGACFGDHIVPAERVWPAELRSERPKQSLRTVLGSTAA